LRRAVRTDPRTARDLPEFKSAQAAFARPGGVPAASALLEALDAEHPDCPPLLDARAAVLSRQGRQADARRVLEWSLALYPDSVDALLLLGYVALAQGDGGETRRVLARLRLLSPSDPRIQAYQGLVEAVR
jgi:predicted Zn-dependent protease